MTGDTFGGFGPTRYTINFEGYNFGKFFLLNKNSTVSKLIYLSKLPIQGGKIDIRSLLHTLYLNVQQKYLSTANHLLDNYLHLSRMGYNDMFPKQHKTRHWG